MQFYQLKKKIILVVKFCVKEKNLTKIQVEIKGPFSLIGRPIRNYSNMIINVNLLLYCRQNIVLAFRKKRGDKSIMLCVNTHFASIWPEQPQPNQSVASILLAIGHLSFLLFPFTHSLYIDKKSTREIRTTPVANWFYCNFFCDKRPHFSPLTR